MSYDYIIVGAGPTGLTLAYGLACKGKTCLLVDRQPTIGGCHRVLRVNGFFTEHSPRVYLSSYVNMFKLFHHMNIHDLFTSYEFQIGFVAEHIVNQLSWYECLCISWAFVRMMIDPHYGETISVLTFATNHSFSADSKAYLDRLCRFTDGAGSDRYNINQLLQILNQNAFYRILQPTVPNDIGMFPRMQYALENKGVSFLLSTSVERMILQNNKVTGLVVTQDSQTLTLNCSNVILAVTPKDLVALLPVSAPFGDLSDWVIQSSYNVDVAGIFHWDQKINLPKRWGFPISEWGLVFITLSDYMTFGNPNSKTVISTCITILDVKSKVTGKTANETTDPTELVAEMFRQLMISFPQLPPSTFCCLSPTVYHDHGVWQSQDSAYIHAAQSKYLPSSGTISNLYQVGIQNGNAPLSSTTFDSAVANALAFLHQQKMTLFPVQNPHTIRNALGWVLVISGVILLCYVLYRWNKPKSIQSAIEIPMFEPETILSEPIEIPSEPIEIPSEPLIAPPIEIPSDLPVDQYDPSA